MEAGGKDCEEETLQTAFKKLRVDAESLPAVVNVSEALGSRTVGRGCAEASGAKPKLGCTKDNWHGCMRKTSRGASRTQRRRRSKSPILHPPKFTYCSTNNPTVSSLSPTSGPLKHQRLAVPEVIETCPGSVGSGRTPSTLDVPAQNDLLPSGTPGHMPPPVFGASAGYKLTIDCGATGDSALAPSSTHQEISNIAASAATMSVSPSNKGAGPEIVSPEGAEPIATAPGQSGVPGSASDFQALSKLHSSGSRVGPCPCPCSPQPNQQPGEGQGVSAQCQCEPRCQPGPPSWNGVEVYSFTGLRNVISECEKSLPSNEAIPPGTRTQSSASGNTGTTVASPSTSLSPSTSGSPRSCSEQARAFVDDITIEDLSGYMEYYLYIPKKMSHMAEMMYT